MDQRITRHSLLLLFCVCVVAEGSDKKGGFILLAKEHLLKNSLIRETKAESAMHCIQHCLIERPDCKSVNYGVTSLTKGKCQLNNDGAIGCNEVNLLADKGFNYFERDTGELSFCQASVKESKQSKSVALITGNMTIDDYGILEADNMIVVNKTTSLAESISITLPQNTKYVVIDAVNAPEHLGTPVAVLASFSNGIVTDESWECANGSSETWQKAKSHGSNNGTTDHWSGIIVEGIPEDAQWISTEQFYGDSVRCRKSFVRSCADLYKNGENQDGVYRIDPDYQGAIDVRCDMSTTPGGWTVFQKRVDGSEDFYRKWADYKTGFGDLNGEFWLGLDKIHRLSKSGQDVLRVDLEDFSNQTSYAEYGIFATGDETDKYQLTVGNYSGDAGDSLTVKNGMKFTTTDNDNDQNSVGNCAAIYQGAWWYNDCHISNLNGKYLHGANATYGVGVNWVTWKGEHYSLKKTEMKIRPSNF